MGLDSYLPHTRILTDIKGVIDAKTETDGFLNPTFRNLLIVDKDLARTASTDRSTIGSEIKADLRLTDR
jgi:hypothetical protein